MFRRSKKSSITRLVTVKHLKIAGWILSWSFSYWKKKWGSNPISRCLALPAYPIVDHPASIRPSVNFFSLSHLLQDHWSDIFETCLRCSPSSLVVRSGPSTNMAAGSHLLISPLSYLLRKLWRNFVETLHMNSSQCLDVTTRQQI